MATTKRIHSSPDWDMTPLCHSRVMDTMPRSTEFFGQRQAGENWQCRCCCCCCCWCCCCYRSWIFKQIQAQRENNEIMVSWSKLGPFSTYERKRWRKLSDVAALCCLHPTKTECPAIFLLISTWSYMNRCPQNCHAPGVFFPKKNIWLKGHCCFFLSFVKQQISSFQLLQSGLFLSTQTYRTFLLVVAFVIGRFWPGPARSVSFGKLETFVYCSLRIPGENSKKSVTFQIRTLIQHCIYVVDEKNRVSERTHLFGSVQKCEIILQVVVSTCGKVFKY